MGDSVVDGSESAGSSVGPGGDEGGGEGSGATDPGAAAAPDPGGAVATDPPGAARGLLAEVGCRVLVAHDAHDVVAAPRSAPLAGDIRDRPRPPRWRAHGGAMRAHKNARLRGAGWCVGHP